MSDEYTRQWEPRRAGRSAGDAAKQSYYGVQMVRAPDWDWKIALYFFFGGISSMAFVIASFAELLGGKQAKPITRAARYISLAALIPSPILLIMDLGRPERFFHMLRVLKLRSAMSLGTWGLSVFGVFSGLAGVIQAAEDGLFDWLPPVRWLLLALPRAPMNVLGSLFGFFVGGYTGVLLGVTAIPIWAKNQFLLGPLFLSSAMSNAAAAISLVLALRRGNHGVSKRIERIETVAMVAELGLSVAIQANSGAVISRPLRQGSLAQLFRWGVLGLGIGVPLLLQLRTLLGGKPSRPLQVVSSLCTLAGGYTLRHVITYAGLASAADPEASFVYARKR